MSPQLYHRLDEYFFFICFTIKFIAADAAVATTTVNDDAAATALLLLRVSRYLVITKHSHFSIYHHSYNGPYIHRNTFEFIEYENYNVRFPPRFN